MLKEPTKREAGIWLAAAIDGEGHVKKDSNEVTIANTDLFFIEQAERCLEALGVDSFGVTRTEREDRKTIYTLRVYGVANCKTLFEWCPLSIVRKWLCLYSKTRDKRFDRCAGGCRCGRHTFYPRRSPRWYCWVPSRQRFKAYSRSSEGKQIHLGYFRTEKEAAEAVQQAGWL